MNTTAIDIRGTITEDDPQNPGQTVRVCYQRVKPGLGNVPGDDTRSRQRRRVVTPRDPKTPAQLARRQKMTGAVAAWRQLTAEQLTYWRTLGAKRGLPAYNAFIANYLRS